MAKPLFEAWAEKAAEQWKLILGVVGVVLLVVAGVGIANELRSRRELAATNALYDAQMAARKDVAEKRLDQAGQVYEAMIEQHKGTRAAFEAELQLGDIWMDSGNYDKAVTYYQKAVTETNDPFSRLLSTYTIGIARESGGKLEEAVKAYGEALSFPGSDFLRPEILMAQARCYEALNQGQKAIEIYKTVEEKYASRSYYSGAAAAFEKQLSAKNL